MISDERFIEKVWEKYNNYANSNIKEKFFNKHQYRNSEIKRIIYTIISFIFSALVTTGVAYASITIHNSLFVQKNVKTDFINNPGYQYYEDMKMSLDGIYYKRICNYNEYTNAKKIWNDIVEMDENDFQDSFVIVIAGLTYKTTGLYISNVYVEDDKTCIELKREEKWSSNNTAISARVSRELERNDIVIKNLPNTIDTEGKYIDIDKITINYTIEQALKDGCLVVENNEKIISDKENMLDEFIEKKENGVLRIYKYGSGYFSISDIQYNNGVININCCTFDLIKNKVGEIVYFTGNNFEVENSNFNQKNYKEYFVSNELGDVWNIYTIKNN